MKTTENPLLAKGTELGRDPRPPLASTGDDRLCENCFSIGLRSQTKIFKRDRKE